MNSPPLTAEDILGPEGLLARRLDGFEFRPSQVRMASLIEESLRDRLPVMIEAGTGTGKTFGYLAPLILSGKKVVISTGTKNLQDQILLKDIPLLQGMTGRKVETMAMKGRRNYLCLYRYHQHSAHLPHAGLKSIERWLKKTALADRSELDWLGDDDPLWDAVSSSSDQCLGARCPEGDACFLNELRRRAGQARIIIVNHHLFFSDLKVKKGGFGEIIPRFQVAVFDEAHKVEEIATSYLGESLSTRQLTDLADEMEKGAGELKGKGGGKVKVHLNALRASCEALKGYFHDREERARLDEGAMDEMEKGPVREIRSTLRSIHDTCGPMEADNPAVACWLVRAAELTRLLDECLRQRGPNWLNWYEKRKKTVTIHASPLDISEQMSELLFDKVETSVFTSATISTNGTFDYLRSRLGFPSEALSAVFPSHFDFESRTPLYVPKDLPSPGQADFGERVAERIAEILQKTEGRALVLFTSYHNMNFVYGVLRDRLPYKLYRQGDAPPPLLLSMFREDIHSVLLATGTFWEGVDVAGESLSCLIIDKLPFDSPGEPLVAARIDAIRARGGNPFMDYQLPSAIITLKQGLGRLIRKSSDRGVFAILDKRIWTSRYGKLFLESLPRLTLSDRISDLDGFFEG